MRRTIVLLSVVVSLMAAPLAAQAQDHVIDEGTAPEWLFVMSAPSGSIDGDTLTLDGVPAVLYFSDRPYRVAGHLEVDEFLAAWVGGDSSFSDIPPNAVLSVIDPNGVDDSVIELLAISGDGDSVTFTTAALDGALPQGPIGSASLFIDPIVNPQITD